MNASTKITHLDVSVEQHFVFVTVTQQIDVSLGDRAFPSISTRAKLKYPLSILSSLMTRDTSERTVQNAEIETPN